MRTNQTQHLFYNLQNNNYTDIEDVDERLQLDIIRRRIKKSTESNRNRRIQSERGNLFGNPLDEYQESISESNPNNDDGYSKILKIGYIRKIYGMIIFQLILTYVVSLIGTIQIVNRIYKSNPYILKFYIFISFIILFSFIIKKSLYRKTPYNYIILILFTISIGFSISFAYIIIKKETILYIFSLLILNIFILFCLTIIYNNNIYYLFNILFMFLVDFLIYLISYMIFPIEYAYITFGIYVYVVYIILNTSLLEGMIFKEVSLDDYIYSSLCFYIMDLVYAFVYIIDLFFNNLIAFE